MTQALRLAERGANTTHPNPRVGCVLAREGRVIARAWHQRAGEAHAEILALNMAGVKADKASAYVTLEPCSHRGKTPPCADALVAAGVSEVIFAMRDPNPLVGGQGESRLREAGIAVRYGLMEEIALELNAGFIKRMKQELPWIRIKLAQSLDGRTALGSGESQWITGPAARADVQQWRARASGVLSGIGTVLTDDPSLNVRLDECERQPIRIIVDSAWRTPADARTLGLPGTVLIAGRSDLPIPEALRSTSAELVPVGQRKGRIDLCELMQKLAGREMNELHVEAGGTLAGALLEAGLVDEVLIYQANCLLGQNGLPTFNLGAMENMNQRPDFVCLERRILGDDLRMRLKPQYSVNVHRNH